GIEIELPWETLLARESKRASLLYPKITCMPHSAQEKRFVTQTKEYLITKCAPLLHEAAMMGIVCDEEEFCLTELIFAPTHTPQVTVDQVSNLYNLGLLRSSERLPLHITTGALWDSLETAVLLRSVEIAGNVSAMRLGERGSWDIKGEKGIEVRSVSQLQGDD